MTFEAPYLPYVRVGEYANQFLKTHHPSLKLPIPIEWIIESSLKLRIHPFPNMYRIFNQNGFLSQSRKVIYIDEYQYDNFVEKYRFTLAHEVGHFIMHEFLYEGLTFDCDENFLKWIDTRPRSEVNWLESQANWFAGLVLVPFEQLEKQCIELLDLNHIRFSDSDYLPREFWSYASNDLAELFEVSPKVVEIRIERENFGERFKYYYHKNE